MDPGDGYLPGAAQRRLDDLIDRYRLTAAAADRFAALLELLEADRHAPTTVRAPVEAVDEHLADSLVGLDVPQVASASTIADLGAGAGFPGLPLAIALPDARVSLVESNGRKCAFLRRALAVTNSDNASVENRRAETWPEGLGRFDVITARALAAPAVVAEYAAPLLRLGGTLVIWRGRPEAAAEAAAEGAADQLGLEIADLLRVRPYDAAEHRYLYVMSKLRETPPEFPRRPGVARKRPLGAAKT
jgi:16S rRNA (guanine527-N7)-methyltransferase